ncbi:MAG: VOC family protein [Gammaproteobacteria bacterium]|nr:VOC family protein [Gammaproteobacteria bacterium]
MIHPNSSFPVIIVKQLTEIKSFYLNNFGFNVAFENKWYIHLISQSGVQIGFLLQNQPTQPQIFHNSFNGDGFILSLEVSDAEKSYLEAKEKKLNIVLELKSEDWGQYHFCVQDPNGVNIDIVQAIEPEEEYQDGYTSE